MKFLSRLLLLCIFGCGTVLAQNKSAVVNTSSCGRPEYPAASRSLEEEGVVQLKFLVGTDGKVIESQVEKSSGFRRLDEAARQGLLKCQFKPEVVGGVPQQIWGSMKYTWKLDLPPAPLAQPSSAERDRLTTEADAERKKGQELEEQLTASAQSSSPQPNAFNFSDLTNDKWQKCANEKQICNFDGTRTIRYGYGNKWNFSIAQNDIECSNRIFGDPSPGIAKFCEFGKITTRELAGPQIKIAPIFYVFKDFENNNLPTGDDVKQLTDYLKEARQHYQIMLGDDAKTFDFIDPVAYKGKYYVNDIAKFPSSPTGNSIDFEHELVRELFEIRQSNRLTENNILLIILINPKMSTYRANWGGGGRTFNGGVNGGGGIVVLEYSRMKSGFYGTLVHELGHSFGLTHTSCLNYSMTDGVSIMSYNQRFLTKSFNKDTGYGVLTAEEKNTLLLNKRIFRNEINSEKLQDQSNACVLSSMDKYLGEIPLVRGIGYDLFFNDNVVSGGDAAFFTKRQAEKHCETMIQRNPNVRVSCKFKGSLLSAKPPPISLK